MYRHHTFEERLYIVSRIKSGEPITKVEKETGISFDLLQWWYLRYERYEEEGLRGTKSYNYSAAKKIAIVKEALEKQVPTLYICVKYNIAPSTLFQWCRKYCKGETLENAPRGRPRQYMPRRKKKEPETELEKAQAKIFRLEAEIALLKKVKTLVEEKKARARLSGQKPSTD